MLPRRKPGDLPTRRSVPTTIVNSVKLNWIQIPSRIHSSSQSPRFSLTQTTHHPPCHHQIQSWSKSIFPQGRKNCQWNYHYSLQNNWSSQVLSFWGTSSCSENAMLPLRWCNKWPEKNDKDEEDSWMPMSPVFSQLSLSHTHSVFNPLFELWPFSPRIDSSCQQRPQHFFYSAGLQRTRKRVPYRKQRKKT